MKFTDENGAVFEEVTSYDGVANRNIVIRPVKREPKYEIDSSYVEPYITVYPKGCTPNQVDLIKEAVEALLEWIRSDVETMQRVGDRAQKARESMRENN